MGVPSFFSYIIKNHNKIIKRKIHIACDYFFIDANSMIYDSYYELDSPTESQIIQKTIEKLKNIIEMFSPKKIAFVAFDGVAPQAKMNQQKQRRYKSYLTKHILDTKSSKWNTNAITPGTEFMNKLNKQLHLEFDKDPKIYISDTTESGEGEHKIYEYIRNLSQYESKTLENMIIYGLDADLFMLSLLHLKYQKNIFLYRETKHFKYLNKIDENEDYLFSMIELAKQISKILYYTENEINKAVENYCFLCFLCGNDFLPHFPSINIRDDGINFLIDSYKEVLKKEPLVENKKIYWRHLSKLCRFFADKENKRFLQYSKWKERVSSRLTPQNKEDRLNFLPMVDHEKEDYVLNNLNKYNLIFFHQEDTSHICRHFLEMLEWTWYYYLGYNKNNYIYYSYTNAPLFKDLINNIPLDNKEVLIHETEQEAIHPYSQLLYVLPYSDYKSLLPKEIYENILKKFPNLGEKNFNIHYDYCKFFWECHVEINYINLTELNNCVLNLIKKDI
jgi:5'-3' exonuclease